MNSIKKQSHCLALVFVLGSSLYGASMWESFEDAFEHMERSMQAMRQDMKKFSMQASMSGISMQKGQKAFSITETDDEVVITVQMAGLKQEDISAEINDAVFDLRAKTPDASLQVKIDGFYVSVHISNKGSKKTGDEKDQQESQVIYAREQSFIEPLPAEVVIEGTDNPIAVHFDDAVLEIHCAKVKKATQKVTIQKKTV